MFSCTDRPAGEHKPCRSNIRSKRTTKSEFNDAFTHANVCCTCAKNALTKILLNALKVTIWPLFCQREIKKLSNFHHNRFKDLPRESIVDDGQCSGSIARSCLVVSILLNIPSRGNERNVYSRSWKNQLKKQSDMHLMGYADNVMYSKINFWQTRSSVKFN